MRENTKFINNCILETIVKRAERYIDGIEVRDMDHLVEIALNQWLENREKFEAEVDMIKTKGTIQ